MHIYRGKVVKLSQVAYFISPAGTSQLTLSNMFMSETPQPYDHPPENVGATPLPPKHLGKLHRWGFC